LKNDLILHIYKFSSIPADSKTLFLQNQIMKNKKKRINIVYSTDPDFEYNYQENYEPDTLPPDKQYLVVSLDKKQRKGKQVTLISGFIGKADDLKDIGKTLKLKCGAGGSVKDGEIIIQGDFRQKIFDILISENYNVKRKG